jgi:acetyltransferase-like isoleucine patch superfamily enzyme
MDIGRDCRISLSAKLDKTYPRGIHIGDETIITFGVAVLSHDFVHGHNVHTRIGRHCFIGANCIIMPGVVIGDGCIVGAGTVVVQSVPSHSIVVGNPGRIIRSGIVTGPFGILSSDQ